MILLIITVIGSILAIIFIPKSISKLEMYTTSFFAMILAVVADVYLDLKFDYYGFFNKGVDWLYLPIFIFVYPAANIVFLNFYPFERTWMKKVLYVVIWTFLTTGFEYLSLHTEVFYHHEWKLRYSFLCYPFLYWILALNLRFIRFLAKNN